MDTKKFSLNTALIWHSIEAFGYHVCLMAHNIAFFLIAPRALCGQIGAIFSILYVTSTLLQFGILDTIATFFPDFSQSRRNTKTFLTEQLAFSGLLLIVCLSICSWFLYRGTMREIFTPATLIATVLAIITETLNKILRRLLRLSGDHFSIIATSSIMGIVAFVAIVWGSFFIAKTDLQVLTMLSTLVVVTFIELCVYCCYTYTWYYTLPDNNTAPVNSRRIFKNRVNNVLLEIERLAISGNILVPAVALSQSLEHAAILKVCSSIVHNSIAIGEKIIDTTNILFLSHHKYKDTKNALAIVHTMASSYNFILCACIVMALLGKWYTEFSMISGTFLLYQVLQFTYKIKSPYTKLLITQEQVFTMASVAIIQICTTIAIMQAGLEQITSLVVLIAHSFVMYMVILYVSRRQFQTKLPSYVLIISILLLMLITAILPPCQQT